MNVASSWYSELAVACTSTGSACVRKTVNVKLDLVCTARTGARRRTNEHEQTMQMGEMRVSRHTQIQDAVECQPSRRVGHRLKRCFRPRLLRVIACVCLLCVVCSLMWLATTVSLEPRTPRPLNILFVGNSFTYGPPSYDQDQRTLNNLPRMFKLVAESLGRQVQVAEDTIGGCTLHVHRPSINPESCPTASHGVGTPPKCKLVRTTRVDVREACTVGADVNVSSATYHPCPQLLMRQPMGAWDVVALQDHSRVPTIRAARDAYLLPTVAEFASALAHSGQGHALLLAYSTWAYHNGGSTNQDGNGPCPRGSKRGCFPLGSLPSLTPDCAAYDAKVHSTPCMSYSLARGYAESLRRGADVLVPVTLAWLAGGATCAYTPKRGALGLSHIFPACFMRHRFVLLRR